MTSVATENDSQNENRSYTTWWYHIRRFPGRWFRLPLVKTVIWRRVDRWSLRNVLSVVAESRTWTAIETERVDEHDPFLRVILVVNIRRRFPDL